VGQIDFEHFHCGPSDLRTADKDRAFPAEVVTPGVSAGMEEAHDPTRERIDTRDVAPLVIVARETGEAGIVGGSGPAVLQGDDVVDLVRERAVRLVKPAVFAPILSAASNQS